ncbi:MAG: hypothetical protein AB8I08_15590 [Sandaracinaceae bacterium]
MTRHFYIFGPLGGVLLGVVLSFIRLPRLAWLPVAVAGVLVISLVGAMWKALRRGGRTGEKAMLSVALPGVNVVAPFYWIARWPRVVREALPEREDDEGPSSLLFLSCAALYAAASGSLLAYGIVGGEGLGLATGAVGMLFFVFWLAASREAVAAIEDLDAALGGDGPDPAAAEWARERDAVRAAFVTGGGADRAWATDLIVRSAQRGEPEASLWAAAMMHEDPRVFPAVLAGRPLPDPEPEERGEL